MTRNSVSLVCSAGSLALLLLLSGCTSKPVGEVLAEAVALAEAGDQASWQEALARVESCLHRNDRNEPELLNFYIICLSRTGRADQALEVAREAHLLAPENFLVNYLAGKLQYDAGNYKEAVRYLETASQLNPEHVDTRVLLAASSCKQNLDETEARYRELAKFEAFRDSHILYNELGVWYMRQGSLDKAVDAFNEAARLSKGHPSIFLNLAVLYDLHRHEPKQARRYYVKYIYEIGQNSPRKVAAVRERLRALPAI